MLNNVNLLSLPILFGILILLSFLLSVIAMKVLQNRYPKQQISIFSLFFIFNLSLPVLGTILSIWLIYYFWTYRHEKKETGIKVINLNSFFAEFPIVTRELGGNVIDEILRNDEMGVDKKLTALTMLSEQQYKSNIVAIKKILLSTNDELRLLSFAAINSVGYKIHKKIHNDSMELEANGDNKAKRVEALTSLALSYWELVYFELADDTLKVFLLDKIEAYCKEALQLFPGDSKLFTLLGKAYFEHGKYQQSEKYFLMAIKTSTLTNSQGTRNVLPYIQEIYYNQHRFEELKATMKIGTHFNLNPKLKPIQAIWAA